MEMDICGLLNSYTFGLCPHPLNFLPEYLSIVCRSLKAETTAIHFINDKNDGGDHNITANEDSDSVNGGNEDVNHNSIDGNCGNEGDGKDHNIGNGDGGEDNGTCGHDNGVNALGNGCRGSDDDKGDDDGGDEDDYVRHRNGNGGEKEGRVVMMMEAEIVM